METLPSKGTDERDTAVVVEWEGPEGPGEVLGILFSVFLMTISVAVPALGVLYGLAIIFPQFGVFIYGALLVHPVTRC